MHVLFATHQAVGLHQGGVRTQMLQTKAALEDQGVTVTLYEMWKEFDPEQYDLVHIFSANFATYHFARALRLKDIPFVVSPVFFTRRSPGLVRSVVRLDKLFNRVLRGFWTDYGLISEMCGWAKAVLPNTQAEMQLMQRGMNVAPQNLFIAANGVEDRFAKASPDLFVKQYGVKDFILYVGQIGPHRKNVYRLLQALEQINHPVVFIGAFDDSPSGRLCLERAKQNKHLVLAGEISHDSMMLASAYKACSVFVLPSQYETPGISALEAAVAGARIVITPYGGTTDYFGTDAIYVQPDSVADIRKGIQHALQAKKDSNLRDHILKEFAWSSIGKKTKQVYEHVVRLP